MASGVVAARDEPDYPTVVAAAYVGMVVVVLLSSTFLTTRVQSTREHLRRLGRDLIGSVLPSPKGIRLVGVTVSNFEAAPAERLAQPALIG